MACRRTPADGAPVGLQTSAVRFAMGDNGSFAGTPGIYSAEALQALLSTVIDQGPPTRCERPAPSPVDRIFSPSATPPSLQPGRIISKRAQLEFLFPEIRTL